VLAYLTPGVRRRTVSEPPPWRSRTLETQQTAKLHDELERLRAEVAELRASRMRLVLAGDADCRSIEGELHESVQQHLVALAVKLQLAGPLVDADPAGATALLEEMGRDVQAALDEAARLAHRIYPQLLEQGGLTAVFRSAAARANVPASIDVKTASTYGPEILRAVYLCWLEALEHPRGVASATATVREEQGALAFEFSATGSGPRRAGEQSPGLAPLRDRVEALGGRLTVESDPGREIHLSGSLPLSNRC
jgi:signal transduction histidine kinase